MAVIPPGTKFHGVDPPVPTRDKKSALLNSYAEAYTIEDIVSYFQAINLGWCRYDDDQYTSLSKLTISDGVPVTSIGGVSRIWDVIFFVQRTQLGS